MGADNVVNRYCSLIVVCLLFFSVAFLQGCDRFDKSSFKTPYQAVLLDSGFAYFGKIDEMNRSFITVTDVFYIQTTASPDGKPAASVLVKRGKELHGPDRMYINTRHIIMIEPVSPDSKVAQIIKEEKEKAGNTKN